ncbi:MAG: MarR family winged helix-turn-helix transcriptional regulator [Alphaproteobacteria bacterium]
MNDDVLALERFLPYRLSVLTNTVSRALARVYQDRFGLSIPQWRVMAALGRFPGLSANEVAEKTAMDKVTVSRAVSGMLDRDLLARVVDTNDRRRASLTLAAAGAAIYAEIVPVARDYERRLAEMLSEEDQAALDRLLDKLTERAREISAG